MVRILRKKIQSLVKFTREDIWRMKVDPTAGRRSFWIRQLRILLLAMRGFDENKCELRSSALTFYTLLSIVPIFAMAFGVAKGFGLQNVLEEQIYEHLPGQEEVVYRLVEFSNTLLENTKGGVIAGIGVLVLLWTVIRVLSQIEDAFNDIWGIRRGRAWMRKMTDYISLMFICPVLLISASSLSVMLTGKVEVLHHSIRYLGWLEPVILVGAGLVSYTVIWFLFTFLYVYMPNTKVRFRSAILAGIMAGTIYQIVQWIYIEFQIGVSKYGAVYGSFAALPLFLIWLRTSWVIMLFGAEISFADQNVETYEFEPDCLKVSHSMKRLIALRITHLTIKRFLEGKNALTAKEIGDRVEAPIRLVNEILYELTETKILAEVQMGNEENIAYQPARNIDQLTIERVLTLMEKHGIDEIPLEHTKEIAEIRHYLQQLNQAMAHSFANVRLRDI